MLYWTTGTDNTGCERRMDWEPDSVKGVSTYIRDHNAGLSWLRFLAGVREEESDLRGWLELCDTDFRPDCQKCALDRDRFGLARFDNGIMGTTFLLRTKS